MLRCYYTYIYIYGGTSFVVVHKWAWSLAVLRRRSEPSWPGDARLAHPSLVEKCEARPRQGSLRLARTTFCPFCWDIATCRQATFVLVKGARYPICLSIGQFLYYRCQFPEQRYSRGPATKGPGTQEARYSICLLIKQFLYYRSQFPELRYSRGPAPKGPVLKRPGTQQARYPIGFSIGQFLYYRCQFPELRY